jgi:hypothetical protein
MAYVMIARIPVSGVVAFEACQSQVLPLLAEHDGQLQRRLRSDDGQIEVHLIWFPATAAFEAWRADRRRARHAPLLQAANIRAELLCLGDIP